MQLVSSFCSKNILNNSSSGPKDVAKFNFRDYRKAHPEIVNISTAGRAFIELTGVHPNQASLSDLPAKQFLQETRAIKKSSEAPSFAQLDSILKKIPSLNRYAVIQQALTIARKTPSSRSPQLIEHLEKQLKRLKPTQYRSAEELKRTEARTPLWQKVFAGFAILSAIGAFRTFTAPITIQPDFKPPLPLPEKSPNPHFVSHNPFRLSEPLTTHNPFNPSSYPLSLPRELTSPFSDGIALAPVPDRPFFKPWRIPQFFLGQASSLFQRTGDIVAKRNLSRGNLFPLIAIQSHQEIIERIDRTSSKLKKVDEKPILPLPQKPVRQISQWDRLSPLQLLALILPTSVGLGWALGSLLSKTGPSQKKVARATNNPSTQISIVPVNKGAFLTVFSYMKNQVAPGGFPTQEELSAHLRQEGCQNLDLSVYSRITGTLIDFCSQNGRVPTPQEFSQFLKVKQSLSLSLSPQQIRELFDLEASTELKERVAKGLKEPAESVDPAPKNPFPNKVWRPNTAQRHSPPQPGLPSDVRQGPSVSISTPLPATLTVQKAKSVVKEALIKLKGLTEIAKEILFPTYDTPAQSTRIFNGIRTFLASKDWTGISWKTQERGVYEYLRQYGCYVQPKVLTEYSRVRTAVGEAQTDLLSRNAVDPGCEEIFQYLTQNNKKIAKEVIQSMLNETSVAKKYTLTIGGSDASDSTQSSTEASIDQVSTTGDREEKTSSGSETSEHARQVRATVLAVMKASNSSDPAELLPTLHSQGMRHLDEDSVRSVIQQMERECRTEMRTLITERKVTDPALIKQRLESQGFVGSDVEFDAQIRQTFKEIIGTILVLSKQKDLASVTKELQKQGLAGVDPSLVSSLLDELNVQKPAEEGKG